MKRRNRLMWTVCALAAGLVVAAPALSQDYPNKTVKMVVPYAPGGLPDTMSRIIGHRVGEALGQQFVIENRPGAGGIAGCEAVAKAAPDGYTLLIADVGQLAINPALYSKLSYDPMRDFTPVSLAGIAPIFLAVSVSVPVNSLAELIKFAKANPGRLTYGSSGTGSIHHLNMEALKSGVGIDLVHVPYKGAGQSIPALVAGQVSMVPAALPALSAHIKAGKVKLLAVNTQKRSAQAPDVPTVAEVTGLADYHYPAEIGVLATAGTPKAIVDRLSAEIAKAVRHPDTVQRFTNLGIEIVGGTPEEYAAIMRSGLEKYAKVVKAAKVKID